MSTAELFGDTTRHPGAENASLIHQDSDAENDGRRHRKVRHIASAPNPPRYSVSHTGSSDVDPQGDPESSHVLRPTMQPPGYTPILRFSLLNLIGFSLLGSAYLLGLVDTVIAADRTHLCLVIFGVFLAGFGLSAWKIWQTNREMNSLRSFSGSRLPVSAPHIASILASDVENRAHLIDALRIRLSHRINVVRHLASNLVLLGLIGTVLGFIIALTGVVPEQAGDVSAITPMVASLVEGMSTALYTTLVGAILHVWLNANYQLLVSNTVRLIESSIQVVSSSAEH